MYQKIPFIGESYKGRSQDLNGQRCVNWYVEIDQSGKYPLALYPTPGLETDFAVGSGPIRCIYSFNGKRIVVSGNEAYVRDGSTSTLLGTLNTSAGVVVAADNGLDCVLVDGTYIYEWDGGTSFHVNGGTPGDDIPAPSHVTFLEQRLIFNDNGTAGTGTGKVWWTEIASTNILPLNFATAESDPDSVLAVLADHSNVWVFGTRTTEIWGGTGSSVLPFVRNPGGVLEVGCAARYSVAKGDHAIMWLGNTPHGGTAVYQARGFDASITSNPAIDFQIASYGDVSDARGYCYMEEGRTFYMLNFPGAARTWGYEFKASMWHERQSHDLTRHRGGVHCYHDGSHYVGDFVTGTVYRMGADLYDEDGQEIVRFRDSQYVSADRQRLYFNGLELEFDTGNAAITETNEPQAMLTWSDDGGRTWSNELWRGIGLTGQYAKKTKWLALGSSYARIFRVTVSAPYKTALVGAYMDVEPARD